MGNKKKQRAQQRKTQRDHQQQDPQYIFDSLFKEALSIMQQSSAGRNQEMTGRHKPASDKFLEAVEAAPSVWTIHRYFCFGEYLSLRMQADCPNPEDVEFVKERFIYNEKEPAHFRASAVFWAAGSHFEGTNMNMNSAAELCRLGLDIIAESPRENENQKVLSGRFINYFFHDIGDQSNMTQKKVLQYLGQELQKQASMAEGNTPGAAEEVSSPEHALLIERAMAGGKTCDSCGKTLQEAGLEAFVICQRCEMVFYCSAKCQKKNWKHQDHKQTCREPGQIEVGDDMQLQDYRFKDDLVFVKVMGKVKGQDETTTDHARWQVKLYGTETVLTVNADKLVRIRPPPYQESSS